MHAILYPDTSVAATRPTRSSRAANDHGKCFSPLHYRRHVPWRNPSPTLYFSSLAVGTNHRALEARDDRPT